MKQSHYPQIHLSYLDGLRGISSLYVVIFHLHLMVIIDMGNSIPIWIDLLSRVALYGSSAVKVFIVLSGYCLMLPVVRYGNGYLPGSLWDYFQRRARRILPPYYAALIFCLLLSAIILGLQKIANFQFYLMGWDLFSPYFSFKDVLLHFLVIHNIIPGTSITSINAPMWSVALEWQIYFIFPLLLLPVWRYWGCLSMLAIALIIGLTPHYLFNGFMDSSCPWFLALFGLGMIAADIGFSTKPNLLKLQKSLPWGLLAIISILLAGFIRWKIIGLEEWVFAICFSIAVACLMIYCTNCVTSGKKLPRIVQILESPIVIALGSFSYSLYLTHAPILFLVRHFLLSLNISHNTFTVLFYVIGITTCLVFSYLFHLIFEQRFTKVFR